MAIFRNLIPLVFACGVTACALTPMGRLKPILPPTDPIYSSQEVGKNWPQFNGKRIRIKGHFALNICGGADCYWELMGDESMQRNSPSIAVLNNARIQNILLPLGSSGCFPNFVIEGNFKNRIYPTGNKSRGGVLPESNENIVGPLRDVVIVQRLDYGCRKR